MGRQHGLALSERPARLVDRLLEVLDDGCKDPTGSGPDLTVPGVPQGFDQRAHGPNFFGLPQRDRVVLAHALDMILTEFSNDRLLEDTGYLRQIVGICQLFQLLQDQTGGWTVTLITSDRADGGSQAMRELLLRFPERFAQLAHGALDRLRTFLPRHYCHDNMVSYLMSSMYLSEVGIN